MRIKFVTKLTLTFLISTIIALGVITLFAYIIGRNALQAATNAELLSTSLEKQASLESWINDNRKDLYILAKDEFLVDKVAGFIAVNTGSKEVDLLRSELSANLTGKLSPTGNFTEISLLNPKTGEVLFSTSPNEVGKFHENLPYFIEGRKGPYLQEFYFSTALQSISMTASAPILSKQSSSNANDTHPVMAVLAGSLNLDEMATIIQRRSGLHTSDDSYLVGANHLLITKPRFLPDATVLQTGIYTVAVNTCLTGKSGEIVTDDYRGIPSLINFRWLADHKICLIVKMDQVEAFATAADFGRTIAIISLLVLLFVSFLTIWLSRNFSRPIQKLLTGTEEISNGNLKHRINIHSGDEFETLGIKFNQMASTLFEKDVQLQNWAKSLEEKVEERTKELNRSNSDLERFAYVASHDLQEPLRMVTSYLQLLERRYKYRLDGDALEFIEYAVDGAERMKTLIIDLLAYSRIGTRGKAFILTDCNIVLIRVLTFLKAAIDETNAKISYDSLPEILADETQMEQLFQNLIANAIKFHGKESPRIHIGVDRKGEDWVFSIQDHGIGIDPKYFDRVFIIFQRLHTRQDYPGTGIGLAICKRIIERHGGRIWIEFELEKGSTFFFTIPIKGANDDQ